MLAVTTPRPGWPACSTELHRRTTELVRPITTSSASGFVELRDLSWPRLTTADVFGFVLDRPSELSNLADYQLRALAEDSRYTGP